MWWIVLLLGIGGWKAPGDSYPPILVSIVCHNEEPAAGYPDFVADTEAFWQYREALVNFSQMLYEQEVAFNFQSDWNFLLAATLYDTGTASTNGKNVVRYLVEDLGFEADPHAHETQYNYADVAYLLAQLMGGDPSHTVGGYIAAPPEEAQIEYFRDTLYGWHYPYAWKAQILWGGATRWHIDEDSLLTSGVWRPPDNAHYLGHDPEAPLPEVGGYNRRWDGLLDLLQKQASGELHPGRIYTHTLFVEQVQMLDTAFIAEFRNRLQSLDSLTAAGRIRWVGIAEAVQIWQTEYDERPNLYSYLYGDITPPFRDSLWLQMDDGIRLEATLFRPVDPVPPGGFPGLIFVHGLGGSKRQMEPVAESYARRGYVTLAYSVRGQGFSEGLSTLFSYRERQDLGQIVQWLKARPEVNDTLIGVSGASQGGFHAWFAGLDSLGVRAVAPANSTPMVSECLARNGCYLMPVTAGMLPTAAVRVDTHAYPVYRWLLADEYDSVRAVAARGRDFDSTRIARSESRFLIAGAWHDHVFWTNHLPGAHAVAPRQPLLYLGTGGHGSETAPGEIAFRNLLGQAFFDAWLLGRTEALDTLPAITVALGPTWQHRTFDAWPEPTWLSLYLHGDGSLTESPPTAADTPATLVHARLMPEYTWEAAVQDYFRHVPQAFLLNERVWTTEPLIDTLILLGAPRVQVFARSSAPRFQINFQLYDLPPAGTPVLLTQVSVGIRNNPDTTQWHNLEGAMNLVGWVVPPGHRLRLRWVTVNLAPADTFLWAIPYWADGRHILALDPAHPAVLRLPLLQPYGVGETPIRTELQVWPVPARGWVFLTAAHPLPSFVELYGPAGRRLYRLPLQPGARPGVALLPLPRLPSGVYFVKLPGKAETQKIVIVGKP